MRERSFKSLKLLKDLFFVISTPSFGRFRQAARRRLERKDLMVNKVVKVVRGILPHLEKLRKIKDSSGRRARRKIL